MDNILFRPGHESFAGNVKKYFGYPMHSIIASKSRYLSLQKSLLPEIDL
jgi:hypothetical protein